MTVMWMMNIGTQTKMGLNIPIEQIDDYIEDYLWDNIREHIKLILWESGEYSWTDLESSDEETDEWSETEEEQTLRINELIDHYENQNEIIDFSDIINGI